MKNLTQLAALFFTMILIGCAAKSDQSQDQTATETATDTTATELTYQQVVEMVFGEVGEGIEWHGEELPNELASFLTIASGDLCGENDCGKQLSLASTADKPIELIVRADYDLDGDQGYIPRKYIIGPGETLAIGCSHLCVDGDAYEFARKIVGSEYKE